MFGSGKAVRSGTVDVNGFAILEDSAETGAAMGRAYSGSRSYNGLGECA